MPRKHLVQTAMFRVYSSLCSAVTLGGVSGPYVVEQLVQGSLHVMKHLYNYLFRPSVGILSKFLATSCGLLLIISVDVISTRFIPSFILMYQQHCGCLFHSGEVCFLLGTYSLFSISYISHITSFK